ncbi:MAG TPA: PQQ-dependent sugar dehydrogenase [Longimicrobium sp.]|nr:PQQ-dependent sugar dehydrogenase [Longimicrobium sp.]
MHLRPILAALLLAATAACDRPAEVAGPNDAAALSHGDRIRALCDADNGGLTLWPGFCALVVHDATYLDGTPARARHVAVAPNGDVFVAVQGSGGGVLALRDTDGNLRADQTARFGTGGGHGIAYAHPYLYFARNDRVERYLMNGSLTPVGGPEIIVSGMPGTGDHGTKTIVVAGGSLFVNLGSASDVCQQANRQPGSPGVDPCPELPTRSGVWRYDANTVGQVHNTAARYATGTRNMVALAFRAADGMLYGVQHGRDNLNLYWPALFSRQDQAEMPSEEFFRIRPGADYGWPYCYHDPRQRRKVLGPEYGGNGTIVGRCASAERPILFFPAHWAPNGLLFYAGTHFPEKFRGGAFVAFHGGHNRPGSIREEGFNVVFVPFIDGKPGRIQVFIDGFIGPDAVNLPADADHRPVGLAQGPDGSLYVTDDRGGRIWRVLHAGRD